MSSLSPYYFACAGESPFGFLFDRRMIGRAIFAEWGVPGDESHVRTCVRRFGRASRGPGERPGTEHVTGARMSNENAEELLLSYSADAVYRYYIHDDPTDGSSTVVQNPKRRRLNNRSGEAATMIYAGLESPPSGESEGDGTHLFESPASSSEETDDYDPDAEVDAVFRLPVVLPRTRYAGACNVETVKDVNFLGPRDDWVVSGSDDGNWFMWDKEGSLEGIWEGDGSVVNVIEGHPCLPIVATSGIDKTVKIFAPSSQRSLWSRMDKSTEILAGNTHQSNRMFPRRLRLEDLFQEYHRAIVLSRLSRDGRDLDEDVDPHCVFQ